MQSSPYSPPSVISVMPPTTAADAVALGEASPCLRCIRRNAGTRVGSGGDRDGR